jgi:beta-lactamase regulating signal transducer with metallopeptidase domain
MVHLMFLLVGLGLTFVGQLALVLTLSKVKYWGLRRSLQFWGLVMPLSLILFFGVATLTEFETPQTTLALANVSQTSPRVFDHFAPSEKEIATSSFWILSVPVLVTFGTKLLQVVWLYYRTLKRTWLAPQGMTSLLCTKGRIKPSKIQIRVWSSSRPFAFNLPALVPGGYNIIVISTGMIETLETTQLKAVLWHEQMHLIRRDFQWMWLTTWLRNAFWYLPVGWVLQRQLQEEKELACDERVVTTGGLALTVALTEALLKVWETLLQRNKPVFYHFEAPGLIARSAKPTNASLIEQRVTRLLELGEAEKFTEEAPNNLKRRITTGSLISGSVGLWLVSLELTHLVMLPLGCAFTIGLFF